MIKPRIRDIAQKAGVSPATVSNALGGRPGVSQEVAAHIRQLAEQMGYNPARIRGDGERRHVRLVIYKSHGLVVMDTQFFAELIESVQLECQRAQLELIVSHLSAGDRELRAKVQEFCQEDCAGILLLATEMNAAELAPFKACRAPLVVLDNLFRHEEVSSVVMNNYDAGYQATMLLADAGHRAIGHVTCNLPVSNLRYRRKGYEAAMLERGLPMDENALWPTRPSIEGAYEDMKRLLEHRHAPTALFAANDLMAVGCMRALQECGYRVPEDVSIIGMDDTSVCLACVPMLSTIRVSRREMGVVAVRTLLSMAPVLGDCVVKTELSVCPVMRQSVRRLNDEEV